MQENLFVNQAIQEAMQIYSDSKDKKESLQYNTFLCTVIRMLILIYGEDVFAAYQKKDGTAFENILLQYGFSKEEYDAFLVTFDKFYTFAIRQQKKSIKKKNKYFNLVQKYLIDMLVKRKSMQSVDAQVLLSFYELLFTANSKDFYRKSTAVLLAYNPYEIDEYARKQNIMVG